MQHISVRGEKTFLASASDGSSVNELLDEYKAGNFFIEPVQL